MRWLIPILIITAVSTILIIFNLASADQVPVFIDKSQTKIEPDTISINQMARLTVVISNKNNTDLPCTLKVYGEGLKVMPSTEQNITAYGSDYGTKDTSFTFFLEANQSGTFPVKIELWFGGNEVDYHILYLQAYVSYPIGIVKDGYKTKINPNPVALDQFSTLTVVLFNKEESDVFCKLKVYGQNITVFPSEEQNVTVYGKQEYQSMRETSFTFYLKPNSVGEFPIKIELWYGRSQIDFHTLRLKSIIPYSPNPYEIRVTWVYIISILAIVFVYLRAYVKDFERLVLFSFFLAVFAGLFIVGAATTGELYQVFSTILSPSFGKIELMLALAFILSPLSLIFAINKQFDHALLLANISIFLLFLPIVTDWLYVPSFLMNTLAGKIFWQAIQALISAFFGYIFNKWRKKRERSGASKLG